MESEQATNQDAEDFPTNQIEIVENLEQLKTEKLSIMPMAVPIHNWSDLKDSISFAETLLGVGSALKNHIGKYNKLIDTVAQITRDFNSDISSLQLAVTGANTIARSANTKADTANTAITALTSDLSVLSSSQSSLNTRVSVLENRTVLNYTDILTLISNRLRDMYTYIVYVNDKLVVQNNTLANSLDYQKNISAYQSILNDNLILISNRLKDTNSFLDSINGKFLFLNAEILLQGTALASSRDSLKNISDYQSLLFSAINAVGSKVQTLIDLFNVTDVVPGTFTFFLQGHIKTQTDAIIQALSMVDESINDNFVNYFSDWENGLFWKAFKLFDNRQMAIFFGVLDEILDEYWVELLISLNMLSDAVGTNNSYLSLINDQLSSVNNTLVIVTQWLKSIYEKPSAIVSSVPFDFSRLENMLKNLEFAEIVNESGTNLWDFLKSIVDNLGDIITTQLKEFTKVLDQILDFLDGLIDKLIALIIPENLDFMTDKFNDISTTLNVKFSFAFGWIDTFKSLFNNQKEIADIEISLGFIEGKATIPMSLLNQFSTYGKPLITGFILLEFLIDIYRRIHKKGEVVE